MIGIYIYFFLVFYCGREGLGKFMFWIIDFVVCFFGWWCNIVRYLVDLDLGLYYF